MGSATFFDAYNALSLAYALPVLIRLWHITSGANRTAAGSGLRRTTGGRAAVLLARRKTWTRIQRSRRGRHHVGDESGVRVFTEASTRCWYAGWSRGSAWAVRCRWPPPTSTNFRAHTGAAAIFLLYEMIFPVGLMATGQIGAWLVPIFGWKVMFLIGGIPGLFITWMVARLPESPRWLISQGRLEEAETIIAKIESSLPSGALAKLVRTFPPLASPPVERLAQARWREVLSDAYRSRTMVVWALWACAYFVSNGLNNWMPSLYNTVYHLPLQQSLRAASMTNVAQVALLLICALVIDRVGRRNWMVTAFLVTAALLAVLAFAGSPQCDGRNDPRDVELRCRSDPPMRCCISTRRRFIRPECARSAPGLRHHGCA